MPPRLKFALTANGFAVIMIARETWNIPEAILTAAGNIPGCLFTRRYFSL
jgi:hypothetical protein